MADGVPVRWLAVDGGQSEIRLRLSTGAEAAGPGVQHRPGGNVAGMLASIRSALAHLGHPRVRTAALGMSGLLQKPAPLAELGTGIAQACGAQRVLMFGDDISNHAGALRGVPGVVAALGTGTAVLGLNPAGQFTTIDGRGYLLGDDGSGFQLGQLGLRAVLEHAEGLRPATALSGPAIERFGPVDSIVPSIYRSPAPVAAVASFARDVLATAGAGDETARQIVDDAMDRLARSIRAAARGFDDAPVPVAVVGGLTGAADVLVPALSRALAQHLPTAQVREPAGHSLDGAAWLAAHPAGVYTPRLHEHTASGAAPAATPGPSEPLPR